jgi:hypothetical protein
MCQLIEAGQREEIGLDCVTALQTILNLCIPDKELAKTHFQSSTLYCISKVIYDISVRTTVLDAAVCLWTNIVPHEIMKQI